MLEEAGITAVVSCLRARTAALPMSLGSSGSFCRGLACPSTSFLLSFHGFLLQPTAQLGCKVKAEGDGLYGSYDRLCSHWFAQRHGHPCPVPFLLQKEGGSKGVASWEFRGVCSWLLPLARAQLCHSCVCGYSALGDTASAPSGFNAHLG